jgi:hypothetical protein
MFITEVAAKGTGFDRLAADVRNNKSRCIELMASAVEMLALSSSASVAAAGQPAAEDCGLSPGTDAPPAGRMS